MTDLREGDRVRFKSGDQGVWRIRDRLDEHGLYRLGREDRLGKASARRDEIELVDAARPSDEYLQGWRDALAKAAAYADEHDYGSIPHHIGDGIRGMEP